MHALLLATLLSLPATAATAEKGEPAPALRAPTVAHGTVQLSALRGEIVMISFWATWCPPCIADLDTLAAEDAALRAEGIRLITVNVDQPHEAAAVDAMVAAHGWQMPVLRDPRSRMLGSYYSTRSVPVGALVDDEGVLRELHLSWDEGDAAQLIEEARALREKTPWEPAPAGGSPAGPEGQPADDAPGDDTHGDDTPEQQEPDDAGLDDAESE